MSEQPFRAYLALVLAFPTIAMAQREALSGTWLQLSGDNSPIKLTAAGQASFANYSPLRDDPDLQCKPASLTNIISIPDPPIEIRVLNDRIEIDYEYMDVRRQVPIDATLAATSAPYTVPDHPHLGRSVARFEGEELVVETADVGEGLVNTLFAAEGYPQSTQMRYEERYRAEGDRLFVSISHTDPVNYIEPFELSFVFARVDLEVLEFGCTIEAASYDSRM